jgi:hypothetical protein
VDALTSPGGDHAYVVYTVVGGGTSLEGKGGCTDYPFDSRYRFSPDLTSLVCADWTNCVSQKPCE